MTGLVAMFVVTLIATVVGTVLAFEAQAWAPHVTRRLLRKAFAQFPGDLPADMRARWTEEIEADVAGFDDRPLGGLAFAFRLWRRGGPELAGELALRQVSGAKAAAQSQASSEAPAPQPPPEADLFKQYTLHVHHYRRMAVREDGLWHPLVEAEKDEDDE